MTDLERVELLPCPFCGGEAAMGTLHYKESPYCDDEHKNQLDYFAINCVKCIATMRGVAGYPTKAQAAEKWNTRSQVIGIKEMREALERIAKPTSDDGLNYKEQIDYWRGIAMLDGEIARAALNRGNVG